MLVCKTESLQIRFTNKGKLIMNFEDVARAVDQLLKDPLSGKGVLTVGELIADRIMGMARVSIEIAENPGIADIKVERKKRGRKSAHQKMMEAASAPLESTPVESDEPERPF